MGRPPKDSEGTHLSFSRAHDSEVNGPNHVDGQRWRDGEKDTAYNKGKSAPEVHGVAQSPGYGNQTADIPIRRKTRRDSTWGEYDSGFNPKARNRPRQDDRR
jgi:hypothetical protein